MSKYNFNKMQKISIEEIRNIDLNLLREFSFFCDTNGLKYTLDGGTLIGAIRHKGFIPWDDDIDVSMPYPDYLKFIELFNNDDKNFNGEIKQGVKAGFHYTKYCDKRTIVKSNHRKDSLLYGVWIDVFPMYSIDDDDAIALNDIKNVLYYQEMSWKYMGYEYYRNPIKRLYHFLFNQFYLEYYFKRIDRIINKHSYGETKRIRFVPVADDRLCETNYNHFDKRIKTPFENMEFYIPKEYDKYLKVLYGDYMKLPPEKDRIAHSINAFWK